MLLLLLLLPYTAFACIPMKVIDRGIPAVPGGGGGPAAQITGCKLGAVKQISQADLDARYCTPSGMPPGCPAATCVAPTITATSVTCDDPAASSFAYQLPDGSVNAALDASCANEMWTIGSFGGNLPGTYAYINACCGP